MLASLDLRVDYKKSVSLLTEKYIFRHIYAKSIEFVMYTDVVQLYMTTYGTTDTYAHFCI